ncbi:hypothetical protein BN136_656 [Cronobacter universalis NCTC 9529]|nr:hypothetical protein BN136_656 [Cronobacter universalis NCTC 9529]
MIEEHAAPGFPRLLSLLALRQQFRLQNFQVMDGGVVIARHQNIQNGIDTVSQLLRIYCRHNASFLRLVQAHDAEKRRQREAGGSLNTPPESIISL